MSANISTVGPVAAVVPLTHFVWNRAFFAQCEVRSSCLSDVGDAHIHNDPSLRVSDYDALRVLASPSPVTVYVGTVALSAFAKDVVPYVERNFVLVSGMSDPGPRQVLGSDEALHSLVLNPKLLAWYAEMRDFGCLKSRQLLPSTSATDSEAQPHGESNASSTNCGTCGVCTKVRAIPLGLDLHTLAYKPSDRPQWGQAQSPQQQAADFAAAAAATTHEDPRVYVHFGWYTKERRAILKLIRGNPAFYCDPDRHIPRQELWARMGRHRWVLCLQGGGPDCHRTWEAIGLGCGIVAEDLPFLREILGSASAAAGDSKQSTDDMAHSVKMGGTELRFLRSLAVPAHFAPSGAEITGPDLSARASAKAAWRGGISQATLDTLWSDCQLQERRRKQIASPFAVAGVVAGSEDSPATTGSTSGAVVSLPAFLWDGYWQAQINRSLSLSASGPSSS